MDRLLHAVFIRSSLTLPLPDSDFEISDGHAHFKCPRLLDTGLSY